MIGITVTSEDVATQEAKDNARLFISKEAKREAIGSLKVTTVAGNAFDADGIARQNIANKIQAMELNNETLVVWRMADNSNVEITLNELKEAFILATTAHSDIVTS